MSKPNTAATSWGVCLLLASLVGGGPLYAQGPPLQLSAAIWKREVILQEPILVRLELRNVGAETVRAVPAYLGGTWPVSFVVTDESNTRVGHEYPAWGSPFSLRAYGRLWWGLDPDSGLPPLPSRPWAVAPGGGAFMWLNLLQFYPLDQPGRYHIVFHYDASPQQLLIGQPQEAAPEEVWSGHLEADAGWVTIGEPDEANRGAAAFLLDYRERGHIVLSAQDRRYELAHEVLRRFPESVYAPYAAFYALWQQARSATNCRCCSPWATGGRLPSALGILGT